MEKIIISIIPGVAFACTVFLMVLAAIQCRIYLNKGYLRSRSLGLFCFFSALFAFEHFVAQSRAFSASFTHCYVAISTLSLCLAMFNYMRSLSYFLAVPKWLYKSYTICTLVLAMAVGVAILASLVTGESYFFHPSESMQSANYFVSSYTLSIGTPQPFIDILLSATGVLTVVLTFVLLPLVWKSSRDIYFVLGLLFSLLAAFFENILLPFTYVLFFPVVFMSNMFEAFRMNSLSYREYVKFKREQQVGKKVDQETEKYQNSNLTEERIQELALKLKKVLDEDKVFLNPNLSSDDLAKKIGIPSYQLSQVVNIGLNTTFFELMSQRRIEEVKKRLLDNSYRDETIINIAYSSGFNSKSAFNTAFKKQTGVTPSVFRKKTVLSN